MSQKVKRRFAYFITPHGYGHAARAAAVMNALHEAAEGAFFEIYTRVPIWLFNATLQAGFHYHELLTDVGLVQDSVMDENLPETVRRLDSLMPFDPALVKQLAREIRDAGCEMVLCDVAALGIAVAKEAGLPSVLTENFTWDWIYEGYLDEEPELERHIQFLQKMVASADIHIRTEPACSYEVKADLTTTVVGRKPRTDCDEIRRQLGIPQGEKMILVTMGGIGSQYPFLEKLKSHPQAYFLVPGGSDSYETHGKLILIPHHSSYYHPDLVNAADAVIGKLGYSTLAEAYHAGIPFAYIPRPRFRESPAMSHFVLDHMHGIEVPEEKFYAGDWLEIVPRLLEIPRCRPAGPNGADQIAQYLLKE